MREEWRGERDKERMKELKEEREREIISENEKGCGNGREREERRDEEVRERMRGRKEETERKNKRVWGMGERGKEKE